MNQNDIAKQIVHCCYKIHSTIGPGLFERVYEEILYLELEKAGLCTERQKKVPILWDNLKLGAAFRADLIVEEQVLIEVRGCLSLLAGVERADFVVRQGLFFGALPGYCAKK